MQCNPLLCVWIGPNCIFGLWDTSRVNFRGKNCKNDFQKIIFHYLKIDDFWRIACIKKSRLSLLVTNFLGEVLCPEFFFLWMTQGSIFGDNLKRAKLFYMKFPLPQTMGNCFIGTSMRKYYIVCKIYSQRMNQFAIFDHRKTAASLSRNDKKMRVTNP